MDLRNFIENGGNATPDEQKKRSDAVTDLAEFLMEAMLEDDSIPEQRKNELRAMNSFRSIHEAGDKFIKTAILPKNSEKNADYVSAFLDLCDAFISSTNELINQINTNDTEKEIDNVSE